jgi:hypothetical protein
MEDRHKRSCWKNSMGVGIRELVEFGRVRRVVINICVLNFEYNKVPS